MDVEFIAQIPAWTMAGRSPNTLHALERGRRGRPYCRRGQAHRELPRSFGASKASLRRWSYEVKPCWPDDPAPYYRVSVRCGFATPEAFRAALVDWRSGDSGSVFEGVSA